LEKKVDFRVGDMFDPSLGTFDHIIAMDSIIHYSAPDMVRILEGFGARCAKSMLFTFAPRTPALSVMHAIGQVFPRGDRSPAINPIRDTALLKRITDSADLQAWTPRRTHRVQAMFYVSQAMELVPNGG
ncbi:MAG: magnesium protoporphyrin IX methyltransferase, partial [Pseudomonadota bacterium]